MADVPVLDSARLPEDSDDVAVEHVHLSDLGSVSFSSCLDVARCQP